MKYLLLFLPLFTFAQSFEVVDSPAYYYVLAGQDTISKHTKESKAILKAAETSLTRDNVVVLRPKATFSFSGDVAVDLSDVYARLDSLSTVTKIQGEALKNLYYSIIPKIEEKIEYEAKASRIRDSILENRLKFKS